MKGQERGEIAATIHAMLLRESLYAPRIFAYLYLVRFIHLALPPSASTGAECQTPRANPAKCQLPDIIPIGTHGRTIHRPPAWA